MNPPDKPEAQSLYAALGRVASGLYILTFRHGDKESGMLASWVQQVSFDPPMVAVAFDSGRPVLNWMSAGAALGVNVLGENPKAFLSHFGKGFEPDEPAFEGIAVKRFDDGESPPALSDGLAYLNCRVVESFKAGDHVVVTAKVISGEMFGDGKPATHSRKSGHHY